MIINIILFLKSHPSTEVFGEDKIAITTSHQVLLLCYFLQSSMKFQSQLRLLLRFVNGKVEQKDGICHEGTVFIYSIHIFTIQIFVNLLLDSLYSNLLKICYYEITIHGHDL